MVEAEAEVLLAEIPKVYDQNFDEIKYGESSHRYYDDKM